MGDCDHQLPCWNPDMRCMGCSHRVATLFGDEPTETRQLNPVLWPFEVAGRAEAIVRGWLIRHRRLYRKGAW